MKRPRAALLVLVISLVLVAVGVVGVVIAQWQSQQQAEVATVGSRDLASIAALESAAASLASSPSPSAGPSSAATSLSSAPASASGSASGSAGASASASADNVLPTPVYVRIPAIGVSTRVLPVGLDDARALAIPEDITKVGWYELGVPPGADQGSAVLVAHRDGQVQGHGVFYDLGNLGVGDRVWVTDASGRHLGYRVVSRELISKKRLPYEELFAIDGPARLTLISCGGYYDRNNGGYQDNVVVTAIPLRTAPSATAPSATATSGTVSG